MGSMWISDARALQASVMMAVTRRMMGASSFSPTLTFDGCAAVKRAAAVDGGGIADELVDGGVFVGEEAVDLGFDFGFYAEAGFELGVETEFEGVDGVDVGGVADDDTEGAVFFVEGEDLVLADEVGRDEVKVGGGEHGLVEVDVLHVVLVGEGLGDFFFGGELEIEDDLVKGAARAAGLVEGFLGIGLLDRADFEKDVGDFFTFPRHGCSAFELGLRGAGRAVRERAAVSGVAVAGDVRIFARQGPKRGTEWNAISMCHLT